MNAYLHHYMWHKRDLYCVLMQGPYTFTRFSCTFTFNVKLWTLVLLFTMLCKVFCRHSNYSASHFPTKDPTFLICHFLQEKMVSHITLVSDFKAHIICWCSDSSKWMSNAALINDLWVKWRKIDKKCFSDIKTFI